MSVSKKSIRQRDFMAAIARASDIKEEDDSLTMEDLMALPMWEGLPKKEREEHIRNAIAKKSLLPCKKMMRNNNGQRYYTNAWKVNENYEGESEKQPAKKK